MGNEVAYTAISPLDWYYAHFPMLAERVEAMGIDWLVCVATELLDRADETGDGAHAGPVLHWAHILKTMQASDGSWPAEVNLRTGAVIGLDRTRKPAVFLARLGKRLNSTEFASAVQLATSGSGIDIC